MSEDPAIKDDVIRKMLRAPPPPRGQLHDVLSKIAPDLFRRAAKSAHDINLFCPNIDVKLLTVQQAIEALPEKRMLSVIAQKDGSTGLLVFDALLMDALIEKQTVGDILTAPRVDRPVTDIDISMSEPFQAELLQQLSKLSQGTDREATLTAYSPVRIEHDLVRLALDFEAPFYEVLRAELDLGPGLKTGMVQLWFPSGAGASAAKRKANPEIMELVAEAPVDLSVWLPDIRVSVKTIMSLAPDKAIPVDPALLARVNVMDSKGKPVTTARLGQLNGARAVRLQLPGDTPAVVEEEKPAFEAAAVSEDLTPPAIDAPEAPPALPDIDDLQMPDLPGADLPGLDDVQMPDPMAMEVPGLEKSDFEVPDDLVMPELPALD